MISDHAPEGINITLPTQRTKRTWRLDPLLLADSGFVQFISEQIYINVMDGISASSLWETLQAFLKGQIIARNAYIKKINCKSIEDVSSKTKALDGLISASLTPDLIKKRVGLQTEVGLLTTTQAERLILMSCSRFYEEGDKPSKLLANRLRQRAVSHIIS